MSIFNVIFIILVLSRFSLLVNSSICGVTICRRRQRESSFIKCDTGRILIENMTETQRTFSSLRRICTGKISCDIYRICQNPRNANLRISYTCNILPESNPLQSCTSDIMVLNKNHGVILSPRYPDIVTESCSWRLKVPRNHYAILTVHDFERRIQNCDGGLQIRTKQNCVNNSIPLGLLCKLETYSTVYRACGDVDVDLVSNMVSGLRFWISYQVISRYSSRHQKYTTQYSCPAGTTTNQEIIRVQADPPEMPPIMRTQTVNLINTTNHLENETSIDKVESRPTANINTAERMIFYVSIAIAFLSLNGLIVVTVICIRRQRRLKANGPVIDHSRIPSSYPTNFNHNRPLPPVQPQHQPLTHSPSLMDGYGVVADDIAQGYHDDQMSQSSAYAEVDDTLPYRPQPYKYSSAKYNLQEPDENVYSELTDNDKAAYCEIADTAWHNKPYSQTDQAKLIKKDKNRKSQCSNYSGKSRTSSFEGPFSHFEGKRISQLSDVSDSDDSLFGNEQYDYIESVHV